MTFDKEIVSKLAGALDVLSAETLEFPIPERWDTLAYEALTALERYMADHFVKEGVV